MTMVDNNTGLHFDTEALPERDRFPAFCEEMFRRVIGLDIADHGLMPFRGKLELRRAGAVAIANIATTPVDMIRNASHVCDGDDNIAVQLWRRGAAHVVQGRRESPVKACEGIVLDNRNLGRVSETEASQFWVLTIPRDKIAGLTPNVASFAGVRLRDDLSLRLLFGYLEGTLALGLGDHQAAQIFGTHLIDLIALALGGETHRRALQEQTGVRAARLAAIFRAIADQIASPGLSAGTVAAQLGITPRYVHVLLEQSGQTFNQYVTQERLEKARELLTDAEAQSRKIADIALRVGFDDLSHFNRAFRRYFGDTPSGVRAKSVIRRLTS
jgi:AraC-like DNA-binding protein